MNVQEISMKLFKSFKCIGSRCPINCCNGWDIIIWDKPEYDKLMSAGCSDFLTEKRQECFVPWGEDYLLNVKNKKCGFLNCNNLCSIQLELGEEYLSNTCRRYPRKNTLNMGVNYYMLGLSCYEVVSQLMSSEHCSEIYIENKKVSNKTVFNYIESEEVFQTVPSLRYRKEIFMFLHDLIFDNQYSIETGLALGALAMQKISSYAENGQANRIPEVIEAIRPQIRNANTIAKLEAVKPNYRLKGSMVETILESIIQFSALHNEEGIISDELYREGEQKFNEIIRERPFIKRNLMIGAFFDTRMPFYNTEHSLYDNYCYFAFFMAVINIVAATAGRCSDSEAVFVTLICKICREYMNNEKFIDTVISNMKTLNCTSPAYLASLIK